jgi:photosystem II stability/assembly factor-like uncharacterized protein
MRRMPIREGYGYDPLMFVRRNLSLINRALVFRLSVIAITISVPMVVPALTQSAEGALSDPQPALQAVACSGLSECVAVGGAGHVSVSADGGMTWSSQSVPTRHYLYGVACPSQCIAVGDAGTVLISGGPGQTWRRVPTGTDKPLSSVTCPGAGTCYAVGDGGTVLVSGDGGAHWRRVSSGNGVVDGVACSTLNVCTAVTSNSEFAFHTSDGTSWLPATVPVEPLLALVPSNSVSCSGETCVSAGGNGLLARSVDGGAAWALVYPAFTTKNLYGVACPTVTRCIAVGSEGTILTTNNGGADWSHDRSPTWQTLLGVACLTSTHCLTVGSAGTVLSTSNGGVSWTVRHGEPAPVPPVSVLVVGDSFAHTLALYVGRTSAAYGVRIFDGGLDGCALARGTTVGNPGGSFGIATPISGPCAPTGPGWPSVYETDVSHVRPRLSLLALGPWDLSARLINGQWLSPGQPGYNAYYRGQLIMAIRILVAHGGRVAITTVPPVDTLGPVPCVPSPETVTGCPTETERVQALNAVARQVAAMYPGRVSVIDLSRRLSADGQFAKVRDGVTVRAADGVHLSEPGGEWLAPWLLPRLVSASG